MRGPFRSIVLAAGAALAAPALAAAAWTPSVELGVTDDVGSTISVAINPSGAALAGWTQNELGAGGGPGAVQFAFRPVAGAFGTAVNPDPLAPPFPGPTDPPTPGRISTRNALTGVALDGRATAVWLRSNDGALETASTTTGVFSAPQQLASALTSATRLDQNVAGDVAIVDHDGFLVYKRAQAPSWGSASFGGGTVREASVSVDSGGRALIAWIDTSGRVKVRRIDLSTGAFLTPTRLVAADAALGIGDRALQGGLVIGIGVGTDARGRGVVAWRRRIAGREVVRAAFVRANGTLRPPGVRSVSPVTTRAGQFDVAMAANGNATIAWTRRVSQLAGLARGPVFVSRRSPVALAWGVPAPIAPGAAGVAFGPPSVAMAKTVTYVAWYSDPVGRSDSIRVGRRVNVGPWVRTVLDASVDDRGVVPPQVAARGSFAIVGWRTGVGLCCAAYRASVWDPTG